MYDKKIRYLASVFFDADSIVFTKQRASEIEAILSELNELQNRPDCWNGNDVPPPNAHAIERARDFVKRLASLLESGLERPFVTSDENGEVVLEWERSNRSLTLYIGENSTECIKAWGANMNTEMEDISLSRPVEFLPLLAWLKER